MREREREKHCRLVVFPAAALKTGRTTCYYATSFISIADSASRLHIRLSGANADAISLITVNSRGIPGDNFSTRFAYLSNFSGRLRRGRITTYIAVESSRFYGMRNAETSIVVLLTAIARLHTHRHKCTVVHTRTGLHVARITCPYIANTSAYRKLKYL